jgi:hypothetical protein
MVNILTDSKQNLMASNQKKPSDHTSNKDTYTELQ